MAPSSQPPTVENSTIMDETEHSNIPNDETGLSPASKRILEKCAIPATPAPLDKCFRVTPTLISRPQSAGIDTGGFGFHFAKPKIPVPNFTSRSKIKQGGPVTPLAINNGLEQNIQKGTDQPTPSDATIDSSGPPMSSNDQTDTHCNSTPLVVQKTQEATRASLEADHDRSSDAAEKPTWCVPDMADRGVAVRSQTSTPCQGRKRLSASPEGSVDMNSENAISEAEGAPTKTGQNHMCTKASVSSPNGSQQPISPGYPQRKDTRPRLQSTINSKVTKLQTYPRPTQSAAANNSIPPRMVPPSVSQPSEEDLFYMLIHKLKKRDEAEAATTALKEQMESKMLEVTQANDRLRGQLKQAELAYKKQQEQINIRNALVERWKAKFSKLRTFVTSVGNDFEVLRREGQALKATQDALSKEKQHIQETLKEVNGNTDQLKTCWGQHRETIAKMRHEYNTMEKSLLVASTKAADADRAVTTERNRVAVLEGYIRNYANGHRRQAEEILRNQSHALTKLEAVYEGLGGSLDNLASSFRTELESRFTSCLSLLESLNQKEFVQPQDHDRLNVAIRDLSSQLNSSIEASSKNIELKLDAETRNGKQISNQLTELNTAIGSNNVLVGQLAETRELNGSLQEKLKAVEITLSGVSADRDNLQSHEAVLQQHIADLETEVASLQKVELDNSELMASDISSELQIQLESTSAALTEATDAIKTKDTELREIESKLAETIQKSDAVETELVKLREEKTKIQQNAERTEHRVREELTRANLATKDQIRAYFEQEQHKLKREKLTAERSMERMAEQLKSTKLSLERAEESKEKIIAKMNQQQEEIEALKDAASRRDSVDAKELEELKEMHASSLKQLHNTARQLLVSEKENAELKRELSELRVRLAIQEEQEPLQEALEVLQYEIAEKDLSLLSLKEELSKLQGDAKQIASLRQEVLDKSADITSLEEKLDETAKINCDIVGSLQTKNDELASLEQKLLLSEKTNCDLSGLQKEAKQKDDRISELLSRVQDADKLFDKTEGILKKFGIIGVGESLRACSSTLEERFQAIKDTVRKDQEESQVVLNPTLGPMPSLNKDRAIRKPSIVSTPRSKAARPGSATRECKTTEIVYRSHSIRENMSISPSKTLTSRRQKTKQRHASSLGSRIRPFSQLHNDFPHNYYTADQTYPTSELTDLHNLFPSTPASGQNLGVPEPQKTVPNGLHQGDKCVPISLEAGTPDVPRTPHNQPVQDGALVPSRQINGPVEQDGNVSGQPCQAGSTGNQIEKIEIGQKNLRVEAKKLKRKQMSEQNELQTAVMENPSQQGSSKLPRKGILKDKLKSNPSREASAMQTPRQENNEGGKRVDAYSNITFKRPARSSKYFNPNISPTASITARGGRCGSATSKASTVATRARERPRRRQRGDLYNDRFSQKLPG
ncbi:hypothetical protein FQN50_003733 [Emmonsiellopsis sp. PD_5]|nr:hypothetical protein FQN50_003733 [Emmonsiellopsis sp. PD_5]